MITTSHSIGRAAAAAFRAAPARALSLRAAPLSVLPTVAFRPPLQAAAGAAATTTAAAAGGPGLRWFSSGGGMDPELRKRVDSLNDLFVEAREEIEMAEESKETTYYDEEAEIAQEAVEVSNTDTAWTRDAEGGEGRGRPGGPTEIALFGACSLRRQRLNPRPPRPSRPPRPLDPTCRRRWLSTGTS
jgi:hypothetical protein